MAVPGMLAAASCPGSATSLTREPEATLSVGEPSATPLVKALTAAPARRSFSTTTWRARPTSADGPIVTTAGCSPALKAAVAEGDLFTTAATPSWMSANGLSRADYSPGTLTRVKSAGSGSTLASQDSAPPPPYNECSIFEPAVPHSVPFLPNTVSIETEDDVWIDKSSSTHVVVSVQLTGFAPSDCQIAIKKGCRLHIIADKWAPHDKRERVPGQKEEIAGVHYERLIDLGRECESKASAEWRGDVLVIKVKRRESKSHEHTPFYAYSSPFNRFGAN